MTIKKKVGVAEGAKIADGRTWGNLQGNSLKKAFSSFR